jgi:hypothetical protein
MTQPWEDYAQTSDSESGAPWEDYKSSDQEKGFVGRVVDDAKQRFANITAPENYSPLLEERALRTTGQIAGFATDVIGQGLRSAYKTLMPQRAQDAISSGVKSVVGQPIIADTIKTVGDEYGKLREEYPNAIRDVEAIANISDFLPVGAAGYGMKKAADIGLDIVNPITKEAVDNQIRNTVKDNLAKSIKTSSRGKETLPLIEKYFADADTGIREIVKNKDNLAITNSVGDVSLGALPENRLQMAEAIYHTEKKLFDEYDTMQKTAGQKGVMVDLEPVAKQLDDVINSEALLRDKQGRAIIKYAEEQQELLRQNGGMMTPQGAQDLIRNWNGRLLNKNLVPEEASKAAVDTGTASILRNQLDDIISKTEGDGYQDIKRRYGAVKSLRQGTNKAAFSSFAEKGAPNFFDITSGTALAHGLLAMNPATIAASGFMEAMNVIRRKLSNPDTYVKKMFSDVDSLIHKPMARSEKSDKIFKKMFGEDPLTPTDMPPVPPVGYYMKEPGIELTKDQLAILNSNVPSTEVKGARTIGNPYGNAQPKRNRQKQLPEGQGFTLVGGASDPEVIDAMFTSATRPLIGAPKKDAIKQLPYQGFEISDEIFPNVSRTKMKEAWDELEPEEYFKGLRNVKRRHRR